ncbi:MAG: NAD(P)/FAD-dependent oxidoreductase [Pseudomonadales bacterium]|nr:NAD(P)/FAD-dependent oxidoreductase [Pseudomonadales bacterium]
MNDTAQKFNFDPDELREKYRFERDKRIRTDGNSQWVEVKGEYAHFVEDPYLDKEIVREPLTDEVDVAIIGGGFGGLLMGAALRNAGVNNIRVIEKGGDFGGTWYWNRYPGAACDIEAYIYLPLLEELGYMPKRKFADAPEILDHARKIANHFNLYENSCLQTEVTEMRWDEDSSMWIIRTNRNDEIKAHFVAMANGPLHRPKLPGIPGIDDFKGHTFHTSRWDYGYTGGDAHGNLTGLADKSVGIIGTGATAVQCVPHLGAGAKELYVFQRTPSSVDIRNDHETDEKWFNDLKSGWHQDRMDNFNTLVGGGFAEEDLVNDGWTEIFRNIRSLVQNDPGGEMTEEELARKAEIADFQKMEQVRGRVDEIVKDEDTAEHLKPYYRQFCKRPCFHDDYLPTFNRPNVHLIDTHGKGVERITEKGVVVDGKEYALDCLVFATGFEVGTDYTRRAGYELFGRGGQSLTEKWKDGMRTFHGMHTHGFPNCYVMGMSQTGLTANIPHMLKEQSEHIAYIVKHALDGNVRVLETSQQAEDDWIDTINRLARKSEQFYQDCTPGYYNNEGRPGEGDGFLSGQYGGGSVEFFELLEKWRNDGDLPGLEMK